MLIRYSALNDPALQRKQDLASAQNGVSHSELSEKIKLAMRKIPHPLAVITAGLHTRPKSPSPTEDRTSKHLTGLLVSSFNTVTLTPEPYVSFNIKLPSETYDAISREGTFEISPPWHSRTAHVFGGTYRRASTNANGKWLSKYVETTSSNLSARRVFGLKCQWIPEKSVEVGDHKIMVGKVLEFVESDPGAERFKALIWSDGGLKIASPPLRDMFDRRQEHYRRDRKLKEMERLRKERESDEDEEQEEKALQEQLREAEKHRNNT